SSTAGSTSSRCRRCSEPGRSASPRPSFQTNSPSRRFFRRIVARRGIVGKAYTAAQNATREESSEESLPGGEERGQGGREDPGPGRLLAAQCTSGTLTGQKCGERNPTPQIRRRRRVVGRVGFEPT